MVSNRKPLIGITLGDPNGIGPEVAAKALSRRNVLSLARFCVIAEGWEPRPSFLPSFLVPATPSLCRHLLRRRAGKGPTARSGRAAVESVLRAIDLAMAGDIDAIVTAPISKEAVKLAGYAWPGHTEILAERSGAKHPVMTMVGGGLVVPLVTTHVAIGDLPKRITKQKVLDTLRIASHGLRRYWGIARPLIAVCGLNPHAGEAGQFGREEGIQIAPAVAQARREGVRCVGPLPADVVFYQARQGRYDAVVAMYHDQANIPVKMLAFDSGVNVTLGLPIIRTSPDHGTAYDIAGKNVADPGSMIAAIRMAVSMALRRGL